MNGNASGPASSGGAATAAPAARRRRPRRAVPHRIVLTAAPLGAPTSIGAAQQAVVQAQHDGRPGARRRRNRRGDGPVHVRRGRRLHRPDAPAPQHLHVHHHDHHAVGCRPRGVSGRARRPPHRAAGRDGGPAHADRGRAHARRAPRPGGRLRRIGFAVRQVGTTSGSRTGTTTTGPSAADLASYQRAVDSAAAAVAVAEQAVSQGTIVSPIAGTVSAVNLAVGQSVTRRVDVGQRDRHRRRRLRGVDEPDRDRGSRRLARSRGERRARRSAPRHTAARWSRSRRCRRR